MDQVAANGAVDTVAVAVVAETAVDATLSAADWGNRASILGVDKVVDRVAPAGLEIAVSPDLVELTKLLRPNLD